LLRNRLQLDEGPVDGPIVETASLVAQAKGGDVHAFNQLYRQTSPRLARYVATRLSRREDIEDVTQIVFMRAAQSLHQCRSNEAIMGWLIAIARNVITDMQRVRHLPTIDLVGEMGIEDPSLRPDETVVRSDLQAALRRARAHCLKQSERDFYDLLAQELTYAEISVALGSRVGATRTRYWRLVQRLRQCLGPGFFGEDGRS
jgi:RNA polymerase sigma-70 factor (ECF subfamily)